MAPFVVVPMFAAVGYSLLYLLCGGGIFGRRDFRNRENARQIGFLRRKRVPESVGLQHAERAAAGAPARCRRPAAE